MEFFEWHCKYSTNTAFINGPYTSAINNYIVTLSTFFNHSLRVKVTLMENNGENSRSKRNVVKSHKD